MNAAIEKRASAIAHAAQKRLSAAREKYLGAIDDLEASIEELRTAYALKTWSADPSSSWKARGVRPVPIALYVSDPDVGAVIDALREVVEPPRRPSMPSPFTVAAPQAEAQPEVEPAPAAPDYAAELAAGTPAAQEH